MEQPTLEEALRERDDGIARADADETWSVRALILLERYLQGHGEMFVDDLWEAYEHAGLEAPREGRALGAVFQRAVRLGLMVKSGRSRASVRSHMSDKPIWRSLVLVWPVDV